METYYDIIKAPIITEKNMTLSQTEGKYVFEVSRDANRTSVKQAIEKIFNVKVEKVNIINVKPKKKRVGKYEGKTNNVKKAIVKLKDGNTIDFN